MKLVGNLSSVPLKARKTFICGFPVPITVYVD